MALKEATHRVDKHSMFAADIPFIVALSYRWLERGHPDRCRHHLQIVAKVLREYVQHAAYQMRQGANLEEFGFFWDFASLPQVSTARANS